MPGLLRDRAFCLEQKKIARRIIASDEEKQNDKGKKAELNYPLTYSVVEALDLNRDGTLKVLVEVSRWEGAGLIVYRVDGQNVREVLRTIC